MSERSDLLFNVVQIITGLALLVGVILVLVELRQRGNSAVPKSPAEASTSISRTGVPSAGEESIGAIIKACHSPQQMSLNEIWIMHFYFNSIITRSTRMLLLESVSGYQFELEADNRRNVIEILSFPTGRCWKQRRLDQNAWSGVMRDIVSEMLAQHSPSQFSCAEIVEAHQHYFDIDALSSAPDSLIA